MQRCFAFLLRFSIFNTWWLVFLCLQRLSLTLLGEPLPRFPDKTMLTRRFRFPKFLLKATFVQIHVGSLAGKGKYLVWSVEYLLLHFPARDLVSAC